MSPYRTFDRVMATLVAAALLCTLAVVMRYDNRPEDWRGKVEWRTP